MKTHLNLRVTDLERSVAFYSVLLAAGPVKRHDDYALFVTEDPGLELALDLGEGARAGETAHYGIAVAETLDVDSAIDRLRESSYAADVEIDETCCYARQTKVWTADPDGRRWEIYAVLEETEERDDAGTTCCRNLESADSACCPA